MRHNFPNDITIVCNKVLTASEKMHVKMRCLECKIQMTYEVQGNINEKSYPLYSVYNGLLDTCNKEEGETKVYVSYEEFLKFFKGTGRFKRPFKQTIRLNDKYIATVKKDCVIVDCQTFTHQVIKDLYKLVLKSEK